MAVRSPGQDRHAGESAHHHGCHPQMPRHSSHHCLSTVAVKWVVPPKKGGAIAGGFQSGDRNRNRSNRESLQQDSLLAIAIKDGQVIHPIRHACWHDGIDRGRPSYNDSLQPGIPQLQSRGADEIIPRDHDRGWLATIARIGDDGCKRWCRVGRQRRCNLYIIDVPAGISDRCIAPKRQRIITFCPAKLLRSTVTSVHAVQITCPTVPTSQGVAIT